MLQWVKKILYQHVEKNRISTIKINKRAWIKIKYYSVIRIIIANEKSLHTTGLEHHKRLFTLNTIQAYPAHAYINIILTNCTDRRHAIVASPAASEIERNYANGDFQKGKKPPPARRSRGKIHTKSKRSFSASNDAPFKISISAAAV